MQKTFDSALKHTLTIYYQNTIETIILDDYQKSTVTFGRGPENDIVVDSPIVSSHHADFVLGDDVCTVYDNNSRNGLLVNGLRQKSSCLNDGDILRIDNENRPLKAGVVIIYSMDRDDVEENWVEYPFNTRDRIFLGRAQENDIVLNHSTISKNHAALIYSNQTYYIEDLNSTNGTCLNGVRVSSIQPLRMNDVIYIGDTKIIFNGSSLLYNYYVRGFRLDAISLKREVSVRKGLFFNKDKRTILNDVSVSINPGELVAVIGASGSGKTTLLDCLCGITEPQEGTVLINGDNFFENYEAYKNILGQVPQKDTVYENLTVGEMLKYTARLRVLALNNSEIEERIHKTIMDVQLQGLENTYIKDLSGGQRKRISIAAELLAEPKLFFLDEPTSGLDPETEMNISMLLKKLTYDKKTIVFTTHSTSYLGVCDKIIVLGHEGRLCFLGTPQEALEFFDVNDFFGIYKLISMDAGYWENSFKSSEYFIYNKSPVVRKTRNISHQSISISSSFSQLFNQLWVLTQRYLKLTYRDTVRLIFLIVQAPIISLLLGLIADGTKTFKTREDASQVILILSCSAVWIGLLNSVQEISKERDIYFREKNYNLIDISYVLSKLIVLGGLAIIQSILLIEVLSRFIDFPAKSLTGPLKWELYVTIFLTSLAASLLGLCISAVVRNNDRAIGVVPVVLVFQILFSGLLFKSQHLIKVLSNIAVSNWSSRALGISLNLNDIPYKSPLMLKSEDEAFGYTIENLRTSWGVLTLFCICFLLAAIIVLNKSKKQTGGRIQ